MIITSPTNPIRFTGAIDYEFSHNEFKCYSQKYNLSDVTYLQVLSDEDEVPIMKARDVYTNKVIKTYVFNHVAENITVNETFKVYEVEIVFNDIGVRDFYLEFNDSQKSTSITVSINHKDTVMLKYRNSRNDFGIVFDSEVVFYTRVEGSIRDYTPRSDDEIYNDQIRNSTKLYSLPYSVFTFYAGVSIGLPDFMLDQVNRIFSCDMIKIDDHWFEKTEGAEWEIKRIPGYQFSGMSINVMPARNRVAEQIRIDENGELDPNETMIIQRNSSNHYNVTGDMRIRGVFKKNTVLDFIKVNRKSDAYIIKVGTTPGGNEVVECEVSLAVQVISLRQQFNEETDLYISGMSGANDIYLVYDQVDRFFNPAAAGTDPTPQPVAALGKGAVIDWHGTPAELEEQFNLTTGLGRDTGDWVGWAFCDGENGTPDARRRASVGYEKGLSTNPFSNIGAKIGNEFYKLKTENLPKFRLKLFANETSSAETSSNITADGFVAKGTTTSGKKDEKYSLKRANSDATLGLSSEIGGDIGFSMFQPSIVLLRIKKIS